MNRGTMSDPARMPVWLRPARVRERADVLVCRRALSFATRGDRRDTPTHDRHVELYTSLFV